MAIVVISELADQVRTSGCLPYPFGLPAVEAPKGVSDRRGCSHARQSEAKRHTSAAIS